MIHIQRNSTTHKILYFFGQKKKMVTQEVLQVDPWAFGRRSGQGSMALLEREGYIDHPHRGQYEITPAGEEALAAMEPYAA
jgi:predicted transcriptional regulator